MSRTEVSIKTPDGDARAFVFTPQGQGPWPAAIFFMDAPAIRPALFEMCERLAGHGYYVLLPDMFWRIGPYEPIDMAKAFKDEAARREVFGKMMASTDPERSTRDTGAFLDFLSAQPQVKGEKVGVTGYCMGGGLALRAAGNFPDRVAAAGAFHGGRLATDAPDSPHLLAPRIKAKVLVAGADEDAGFLPEQADRLRTALDQAGIDNEVTIYKGAHHGYAPPDMPVYDRDASERHWRELLALFDGVLKPAA
jgi:carboxymethylenebutenolidase